MSLSMIDTRPAPFATVFYSPDNCPTLQRALDDTRQLLRNMQHGANVLAFYPLEDGSCLEIRVHMTDIGICAEEVRAIKSVRISYQIEEHTP